MFREPIFIIALSFLSSSLLFKSAPPNFNHKDDTIGQCRNGRLDDCEDCMMTDIDEIYSAHYALCGKPWYCASKSTPQQPNKKQDKGKPFVMRDFQVNRDHCMQLVERWHSMREDFENAVGIHDEARAKTFSYKREYFHGHCGGEGNEYYDHLIVEPHLYKNIGLIYGNEI